MTNMEENKDIRVIGSKEVNPIDEQAKLEQEENAREAVQKAAHKIIVNTIKTQLRQIKARVNEGFTMEEIIKEVEHKKSNLPANARQVLINFKAGALNEMIKEV